MKDLCLVGSGQSPSIQNKLPVDEDRLDIRGVHRIDDMGVDVIQGDEMGLIQVSQDYVRDLAFFKTSGNISETRKRFWVVGLILPFSA